MPVAMTFAVLNAGGNAAEVGVVLASATFPFIVFLLVGGVVADRRSRKLVALSADIARALISFMIAGLMFVNPSSVIGLIILSAMWGAARGFFTPSITALLPEVVPAEGLQRANAVRATAISFGQASGPALVGVVVAASGTRIAMLVVAVMYLASASALSLLHPTNANTLRQESHPLADLVAGVDEVRSREWAWTTMVAYAGMHLVSFGPLLVLGPILANSQLGGARAWGILLGAQGVGGIIGSLAGFKFRPKFPLRTSILVATLAAGFPLALATHQSMTVLFITSAVDGACFAAFGVVWETLLQTSVPKEALARVTSLDWVASMATLPLGEILAGPEMRMIGVTPSLLFAGVALVGGNVGLLLIRSVRNIRQAH